MAKNVDIQGIEFQIVNDSKPAVTALDNLTKALGRLKAATTTSGASLSGTAKNIRELNNALKGMNSGDASQKISRLVKALSSLRDVSNIKVSSSIPRQLTALNTVLNGLNWTSGDKLAALADGLRPLTELGRANLTSFINQLGKLPAVIEQLEKADIDKFSRQMRNLASAMKPFADEMQKVSNGFSAFPSKIQKIIASTDRYNKKVGKATKATGLFGRALDGVQFGAFIYGMRRLASWVGTAITKSNEYQENLNLFTVAMGKGADEAFEFGKKVSDALGIDLSEWVRNQGVFNTLLTGFGNTGERAALMSKNLTQLGYDLSSFFNISVGDAMQKLQSGISGELEPLRRLGYDLSQARLEATALSLGIKKSVSAMTQAEKAELRYYAIMNQVTTAQGDLARTLESPANQLRILRAQFSMAARAIGNIFIPALNAILPYAIAVVQVIRQIAEAIASLFGFKMTEVDYSGIEQATGGTGDLADNLDAAGGAAKKLQKYLAPFDELNVLSDPKSTSGVDGIGGGAGFEFELPEYDFLKGAINSRVEDIKALIEQKLAEIEYIIGASLFTLGAMLLLMGHPALGIGLMIAGGMLGVAAVATNWNSMTDEAKIRLATLMEIVGGAMVAIGVILALAGHPAIGFAMIIAGAASIGAGVAIHWNTLEDPVQTALDNIWNIVSIAFLAIGSILAFSGVNIPLGIGLIAVGAAGLAAKAAMNWDLIPEKVRHIIAIVTAAASIGMMALGVILAFSGTAIPLGLGLIAAGAVILGTAIKPNWDMLPDGVKHTITVIAAVLGVSLLVVGAILAFTGVGLPLALGLIAAGAASLAVAAKMDWDLVSNGIRKVVSVITGILGGALIVLGVLLCLSGAGIGLGLAVLAAGLATSYAAWTLDDNPITRFVKKMANGIIAIINRVVDAINEMFHISFKGLSLGGVEIIPAFDIRLVNLPHVPTFANGGFVDEGQLFIAREAGAEMVGSIGNKTAVANNDQIVEGISIGVEAANEGVIAAIYATAREIVEAIQENGGEIVMDGQRVGRSVTSVQNRQNRIYGKSLQNA